MYVKFIIQQTQSLKALHRALDLLAPAPVAAEYL